MKIHEYQAKQLFARYGVAVPEGRVATTVDEAVAGVRDARRAPSCVVKAQIHAGGRGKGGGVKLVKSADEAARRRRRSSACSSSRTRPARGPARAHALGREGLRRSRRSTTSASRSTASCAAPVDDGVVRRRHGHRGGRGAAPREDPQGRVLAGDRPAAYQTRRSSRAASAWRRASSRRRCTFVQALAKLFVELDCSLAEINPLVVTKDDKRHRARREDQLRRQRALPAPGARRAARPRRGGRRRRSRRSKYDLSLHRARRQHRLHGQRRRPRDGDDGHHQALRRRAGELPRRRRRRDRRRRSRPRSASCSRDPNVKGVLVNIFGGIMKCDMIASGVIAAVEAGRPQGAARRAPRGHERRARQEDARRVGAADHRRGPTSTTRAQKIVQGRRAKEARR